jgi:hypothetical protein
MQETPIGFHKLISAVAQPLIRARNERSLMRLHSFVESNATPGRRNSDRETPRCGD